MDAQRCTALIFVTQGVGYASCMCVWGITTSRPFRMYHIQILSLVSIMWNRIVYNSNTILIVQGFKNISNVKFRKNSGQSAILNIPSVKFVMWYPRITTAGRPVLLNYLDVMQGFQDNELNRVRFCLLRNSSLVILSIQGRPQFSI